MRLESSFFARCNAARRSLLSPLPARFMKKVNIRNPDCGPFGETFFDANTRAIVVASFLNNPTGGWVESV